VRGKDDRINTLTTAAVDLEDRLKQKQSERAQLQASVSSAKREADVAIAGQTELKSRIHSLVQEIKTLAVEREAGSVEVKQLQAEVDGLRRNMAEKVSRDRLKADADKSKDAELADLRTKYADASKQITSERQIAAQQREQAEAKLTDINRQHAELKNEHKSAQESLRSALSKVTDMTAATASFENARRELESDLAALRCRHSASEKQVQELTQVKQVSAGNFALRTVLTEPVVRTGTWESTVFCSSQIARLRGRCLRYGGTKG
jgi:myosin protein heavy chain